MTSYQMPPGLLADPYAGAFGAGGGGGLLGNPDVLAQLVQAAQAQGRLGNMERDTRPGVVPGGPAGPGVPIPGAPTGMGMAQIPPNSIASMVQKPGAAGGPASTQPMQPMLAGDAPPGAPGAPPGMGGSIPVMPGAGQAGGVGPQAPTHMISSGYALPISPKVALSEIAHLFGPAASPEGKLPIMGLGGLRRLYASPETLAAEAEAAKAQPATGAETARPGVTWDSGAGEGASNDDGSASQGGGGHGQPDGDSGEGSIYRRGGYISEDGDGKLEERRITAHEGEVVVNPEAVRMLGREALLSANRKALAMKRRPMGLLG